jgi:Cdc6-like AAA superfamily ATPase
MTYILDKLFNRGYQQQVEFLQRDSFITATELVAERLRNGGVSLIWGPPGTGKTTTFLNAIEKEFFNIVEGNEVILYVGPTNHLVADVYSKLASIYQKFHLGIKDFIEQVKIYGSQFGFKENIFSKQIRECDDNTRFILTTSYQMPYLPGLRNIKRVNILVDEASKSPIHVPFIPLIQEFTTYLLEGKNERTSSLSILGDPNQAIGISDELRGRKDLLLFLRLIGGLLGEENLDYQNSQEILEKAIKRLSGKYLAVLDTTFRLPAPSESPISHGFYNRILKAKFTAKERLEGLWDASRAKMLEYLDSTFKPIVNKLEEVLTTGMPIVYVHVRGKTQYKDYYGELFDRKRAEAALYYAVALSYITQTSVTVVTTYTDQAFNMKKLYLRDFLSRIPEEINVSFTTTHKALGSEDNHIVAVLGKEYYGQSGWYDEKYDEKTIYYTEPEIFNVQLSRHKRSLIVVGNLQLMYNTINKLHSRIGAVPYNNLKTTVEKLIELCGGEIIKGQLRIGHGDGGVIHEWPK